MKKSKSPELPNFNSGHNRKIKKYFRVDTEYLSIDFDSKKTYTQCKAIAKGLGINFDHYMMEFNI